MPGTPKGDFRVNERAAEESAVSVRLASAFVSETPLRARLPTPCDVYYKQPYETEAKGDRNIKMTKPASLCGDVVSGARHGHLCCSFIKVGQGRR